MAYSLSKPIMAYATCMIREEGQCTACKLQYSCSEPCHNSSMHILDIQVFLAIDGNLHATISLENEVSKGAMHALKWSCIQVACTWERMRKKFMRREWWNE